MAPEIVDDPKDLTPAWVESALRAAGHEVQVRAIRTEPVGTGQMAHNERIFIDYGEPAPGSPNTLVGKFPSPSEESRAAGASGGYKSEVFFYRDLASQLTIRVPDCYYAEVSEDGSLFTLLLEDMAPSVQGDQIQGASEEQIAAAVRNLAGLHAPLWESPQLEKVDWTPIKLDPGFAPIMQVAGPNFIERYQARLLPETVEVLSAFAEGFARWAETQPAASTLVHGDYRLDNQLFRPPSGGEDQPPVATVDWQTISRGNGARDLAFMLGNGCSPEQRRETERGLLEIYREAMSAGGVELSPEEVFEAYRHGTFQGPYITILGSLAVGQTDRGDDMFMAMAERSAAQIRDLDALSLIV